MTRVTAVLAHSSGELLLLGTEGGHVFIVEVPGFRELEERNISLDQVASRSAATTHQHTLHIVSNLKSEVQSRKAVNVPKDTLDIDLEGTQSSNCSLYL